MSTTRTYRISEEVGKRLSYSIYRDYKHNLFDYPELRPEIKDDMLYYTVDVVLVSHRDDTPYRLKVVTGRQLVLHGYQCVPSKYGRVV